MGCYLPMHGILLVEDEPAIADTLICALETECFDMQLMTGTEALISASKEHYDPAILDSGLPDMTGRVVCRLFRNNATIPVLFLSACDSEVDRVLGLELGGDDYVTKPFSPQEVVARVRAILRRASSSVEHQPEVGVPFGLLDHDVFAMRIRFHGRPLDLTAHEYKLLLVLVEKPGRVFTRDQLLDRAWSDPGSVTDRTVDAHIKSIRSKLKAVRAGAEDYIQTRRRIGYLMATEQSM